MKKTIGILTFEQFHGRADIGSSRIRAHWPVRYWPEAEIFTMGRQYEVVIYQKSYWLEHAQAFPGLKILDICDADFLHWGYRIKQMVEVCDAVTTSTVPLAMYMAKITDKPIWCIPDRLDFQEFGHLRKIHDGNGPTKSVAWFGYSENFPMLNAAINALVSLKIEELIVIANRKNPYELPAAAESKIRLLNLPWTPQTVYGDLMKADVLINPRLQKGRWKYKSNNKTITAWALGIPVADTKEELKSLLSESARMVEGKKRYDQVRAEYDVHDTVRDFNNLIHDIKIKKLSNQMPPAGAEMEVAHGA